LLWSSKYVEVNERYGSLAEVNALAAYDPGQGTGSVLLSAAEVAASAAGRQLLGLAVEPSNHGAIRLYERRGFVSWPGGFVIDRWTEPAHSGLAERSHADVCDYLIKQLADAR
jgi:GNAT superfamily N-acetyltransferase